MVKIVFFCAKPALPREGIWSGAANPHWEKEIETCCKVLMWLW